ncbi:MAG TPA: hypothetical protein VFA11_19490 [Acidimicrobiales bacterium]|nr:hypothetical protein [Acidimicrobiales bacterium]
MTIACRVDTAAFDDMVAGTVVARIDSVPAGRVDFLVVGGRAQVTETEILAPEHAATVAAAMDAAMREFLVA